MKKTNWNVYYSNRKVNLFTSVTRGFTTALICKLVNRYTKNKFLTVVEFGGGDSCISYDLVNECNIEKYIIVDNCELGNKLFLEKELPIETSAICHDITSDIPLDVSANVCISVGLIEHFNKEITSKVIKNHFSILEKNDLVIITYPTPTKLYLFTRKVLQIFGLWIFWDERPLVEKEVVDECIKYGDILTKGINWKIFLTQGYVVVKKR